MQIVYRSRDIAEAHIVSGMLKSEGIESFVGGHYLQGGIGELGMSDFALVRVNDEDYEKAKTVVAEYDHTVQAGGAAGQQAEDKGTSLLTVSYIMLGFLLVVLLMVSLAG